VHVDVDLLVGDEAVRLAGLAVEVELLAVLANEVGCTWSRISSDHHRITEDYSSDNQGTIIE
jgi:hypothetical protein